MPFELGSLRVLESTKHPIVANPEGSVAVELELEADEVVLVESVVIDVVEDVGATLVDELKDRLLVVVVKVLLEGLEDASEELLEAVEVLELEVEGMLELVVPLVLVVREEVGRVPSREVVVVASALEEDPVVKDDAAVVEDEVGIAEDEAAVVEDDGSSFAPRTPL